MKVALHLILLIFTIIIASVSLFISELGSITAQESVQGIVVQLHISPSAVDAGHKKYSIGYVNVVNNMGIPVSTPSDIEVTLASSDPAIASVPASVIISKDSEHTRFDITTFEDGQAEISAQFQDHTSSQVLRVGELVESIPAGADIQIALPSDKMNVNTNMPLAVFLQQNGAPIQAPKDIDLFLDFEKSLIAPSEQKVTIKKNSYYALTTVSALQKIGNAFIRATNPDLELDAIANIQVSSSSPAKIAVNVFPDTIAHSERKIDVFVSLLDTSGSPTIATEDVRLEFFSDDPLLQDSIKKSLFPLGAVIRPGQFGYHLAHGYIFPSGLAARNSTLIGASAQNIGVATDTINTVEPLTAENPKAKNKAVVMSVIPNIPTNATSIIVYQLVAKEDDSDDQSSTQTATPHPIDTLPQDALYPVQSGVNYSPTSLVDNLKLVSTDENLLNIVKINPITTSSSYGTAVVSSGQKSGSVTVSAVLAGIGSGSNSANIVLVSKPAQTKFFSPFGTNSIVFSNDGVAELFLLFFDANGWPTTSKDLVRYVLTPINEFVDIKPKESFVKMQLRSSMFNIQNGTVDIKAVPIGIEAESALQASGPFILNSSSAKVQLKFPFTSVTGGGKTYSIGTVQLTDFYGNPVSVTKDLAISLSSANPDIIKVPQEVTISSGQSFTEFPITGSIQGSSVVSASAKGLQGSDIELSVKSVSKALAVLIKPEIEPVSFNQDIGVKIFVDDESGSPQGDVLLRFSAQNAVVTPETITTSQGGMAAISFKATDGPTASLLVTASKAGYQDVESRKTFDVTGVQVIATEQFFGVPSWAIYVGVAGAIAGIGYGAYMFLRKPKTVTEEEGEEI